MALFYVVVGALVALFAWAAYRLAYLQLRGLRTVGTIVEITKDDTGDGPVYNLVVTFTTSQGVDVKAKSFYGSEDAASYFRVGEQVDILYSAKNPQLFAIRGFDISGVFFILWMVALVIGILYWGLDSVSSAAAK